MNEEAEMKITPMTNAKGEIDYGHAWRYFQMGFTDEYGNRIPMKDKEWKFLSNGERRARFEPVDEEEGVPHGGQLRQECVPVLHRDRD